MEDPVSITLHTFDRLAERELAGSPERPDTERDRDRVEQFVMRTGRPVPKVVVLGGDLALRCRQIDELGGDAIGVDGGASVIALARAQYPEGSFQRGDIRDLPVEKSAYDGAWTGSVLEHIPREDVAAAMQSVRDALRPGGLLYTRVPRGEGEGFEETELGPVYRVYWHPDHMAEVLAVLDFDLLEAGELPDGHLSMVFRREY